MSERIPRETAEALRAALHEARSRLGAIRLAVTSISGSGDQDLAQAMLTTADEETLRLGVELSAISSLIRLEATDTAPENIDLAPLLARFGVTDPVLVAARGEVGDVLDALTGLVADDDADVSVTIARGQDVRVRIEGPRASAVASSAVARALIEAIGATSGDGLELIFEAR